MEVHGLLAASVRHVRGKTSNTIQQPSTRRSVLLQQAPTQKVDRDQQWFVVQQIDCESAPVGRNRHCDP